MHRGRPFPGETIRSLVRTKTSATEVDGLDEVRVGASSGKRSAVPADAEALSQ